MTTPTPIIEALGLEFRKTATIRARQWFKMGDHPAVVMANDVREAIQTGEDVPWIDGLEGGHVVTPGDWIATGIQGEHWPIKPDVFAATYEPVHDVIDFGDAIDPNASHNRRASLKSPPIDLGHENRCPSCNAREKIGKDLCSDGFHAPGETYWPLELGSLPPEPACSSGEGRELLARAREIAADTIGVTGSLRVDYLMGIFDNSDHVRIALAALSQPVSGVVSRFANELEAAMFEPGKSHNICCQATLCDAIGYLRTLDAT